MVAALLIEVIIFRACVMWAAGMVINNAIIPFAILRSFARFARNPASSPVEAGELVQQSRVRT
jgi:hypothetical protein